MPPTSAVFGAAALRSMFMTGLPLSGYEPTAEALASRLTPGGESGPLSWKNSESRPHDPPLQPPGNDQDLGAGEPLPHLVRDRSPRHRRHGRAGRGAEGGGGEDPQARP